MTKPGILIVFALCGGVFLSYMGYFEKPESRIHAFFDAHDRADLAAMISMVDSPEINRMNTSLKLAGGISKSVSKKAIGVELDLVELLLHALPDIRILQGYEGTQTYINIKEKEWDLLRTEAVVHATATYNADNDPVVEDLTFYLKKKNRTWYITDIQEK